uniref:Uncharacterized protein n=1 Tax=Picea glauca TaxID=3330 RepID=A0A101LUF8_PICGL|nr:hypothetical protein ABT39_MTgene2402 [Picea glauca]KUM45570.1 hypothetical protein ABT39_MTgene2405 [Picea glauca]KUM46368.1 hypothetical protein ABT39_MTgene1467 [Picea glauca]KUM47453.1 hypothetical protein ABT39_MTgene5639 [Picea glauca]
MPSPLCGCFPCLCLWYYLSVRWWYLGLCLCLSFRLCLWYICIRCCLLRYLWWVINIDPRPFALLSTSNSPIIAFPLALPFDLK